MRQGNLAAPLGFFGVGIFVEFYHDFLHSPHFSIVPSMRFLMPL